MDRTLPRIIALTGGIGTGKSVVARLLRVMGYPVYDCDQQAKLLMTADRQLRQELIQLFGTDTYMTGTDGSVLLNRPYLSSQIFGHDDKLMQMNARVHPAVARHLLSCAKAVDPHGLFFFESAIHFESGFHRLVPADAVWTVSAPLEVRIERAMRRDGNSRQQVMARIESQMPDSDKEALSTAVIVNDDRHSVIAQVSFLISQLQISTH